jgi:hypothetical protein
MLKQANVVVNLGSNNAYSQYGQTTSVEYSYLEEVEGGYKERFRAVKCRELAVDPITSAHAKIPLFLGGLRVNLDNAVNLDKMLMSIHITNRKAHIGGGKEMDNFIENIPVLHAIEKKAGFKRTTFKDGGYNSTLDCNIIVVEGSKRWCMNATMASIYTALLRLMAYKVDNTGLLWGLNTKSGVDTTDVSIAKILGGNAFKLDILLKNCVKVFGKNRVTGINDEAILGGVPDNCDNNQLSVRYPSGDGIGSWSLSYAHGSLGMGNLYSNISSLNYNANYFQCIEFAKNYIKIEEKELNERIQ